MRAMEPDNTPRMPTGYRVAVLLVSTLAALVALAMGYDAGTRIDGRGLGVVMAVLAAALSLFFVESLGGRLGRWWFGRRS